MRRDKVPSDAHFQISPGLIIPIQPTIIELWSPATLDDLVLLIDVIVCTSTSTYRIYSCKHPFTSYLNVTITGWQDSLRRRHASGY